MIHTASPFFFGETSEDELIKPAVQGTLSVLKVCIFLNYLKDLGRFSYQSAHRKGTSVVCGITAHFFRLHCHMSIILIFLGVFDNPLTFFSVSDVIQFELCLFLHLNSPSISGNGDF